MMPGTQSSQVLDLVQRRAESRGIGSNTSGMGGRRDGSMLRPQADCVRETPCSIGATHSADEACCMQSGNCGLYWHTCYSADGTALPPPPVAL